MSQSADLRKAQGKYGFEFPNGTSQEVGGHSPKSCSPKSVSNLNHALKFTMASSPQRCRSANR